MMNAKMETINYLKKYGQEHLLQFWDELNDEEKKILLKDINDADLERTVQYFQRVVNDGDNDEKKCTNMEPVSSDCSASLNKCRETSEVDNFEEIGLKSISDGHVGVLLLAGGQGTRLGSTDPKGMFDIGLPSKKSLFQLQAERIFKLQSLAKEKFSKTCIIPWYIMTSATTKTKTKIFFEENDYFGLNKENVFMFEQGMLPCFDFNGKIILEKKYKIAKSPDGNGGLYKALKEKNVLEDMSKKNVKYLHVYCVDNILVKVADPIFIGYCVSKNAECAAKVVEKVSPTEPIGVVCKVDGKLQVVEYSEISSNDAEKRNEIDGSLTFKAGNICNHFFTYEFLKDVAEHHENKMKLHKAIKKIQYTNAEGEHIVPLEPNGIKIEKFVFDVFPFATKFCIWEVPRDEEFSALKNSIKSVSDNPNTAKESIFNLHRKYIQNAGGLISNNVLCEISPLLSYAGEGLNEFNGKNFNDSNHPIHLQSSLELKKIKNDLLLI